MKKRNRLLILSSLLLFGYAHANNANNSNNFKYDSVIPPIGGGDYKYLNGCPAVLKKEIKEEACPTGFQGKIFYERTLTADRILFGDKVTCENGGKWSDWAETSRTCVPDPPPSPTDLLKADNCNVVGVNGDYSNWYYFRRNPNQAFYKPNYDAAISSGMTADGYYSTLIRANSQKTYIDVMSYVDYKYNTACNVQTYKSEYDKSYTISRKADAKYDTSVLTIGDASVLGGVKPKLNFDLNGNGLKGNGLSVLSSLDGNININNGTFVVKSAVLSGNELILKNVLSAAFYSSTLNYNKYYQLGSKFVSQGSLLNIVDFQFDEIIKPKAYASNRNVFDYNMNYLRTPTDNNVMKRLVVNLDANNTENKNVYFSADVNPNTFLMNLDEFKVNNTQNLTFRNFDIKLNQPNLDLDNIQNITLTKKAKLTVPKITLKNGSTINNIGQFGSDTYIKGDVYLTDNNTDNYIEALYGHLDGNVYTESPKNYELIDINSCNDVYVNGKNTQWKAFKSMPTKAFLYDLYSSTPLRVIKKNLLDNTNKIYSYTVGSNVMCNFNVLVENETNKVVNITDKNSVVDVLSSETNGDLITSKNKVDLNTVGTVDFNLSSFGTYKGNITIDNRSNPDVKEPFSNKSQNVIYENKFNGNFTYYGNGLGNGKLDLKNSTFTGNVFIENVKTVNLYKYTASNNWLTQYNITGSLTLKNVTVLNVNDFNNITNNVYVTNDDGTNPSYVNLNNGSNVGSDFYLNNVAYFNKDATSKHTGQVFDERVDGIRNANFCSNVSVNGSSSGWRYFDSIPNIAFNTDVYKDVLVAGFDSDKFKAFIQVNGNKTYVDNKNGKLCLVNIANYNVTEQKAANINITNDGLLRSDFNFNYFSGCANPNLKYYFNNLVSDGEFQSSCGVVGNSINVNNFITQTGEVNINSLTANSISGNFHNKNVTIDKITTYNFQIGNHAAVSTYANDLNVNTLKILLKNNNNVIDFGKSGSYVPTINIGNLVIEKASGFTPTPSNFKLQINSNSNLIKFTQDVHLDNIDSNLFVVINNKNNSVMTGRLYLNSVSMFEQDSSSKLYGKIFGGNQDYSSVGQ